MRCEYMLMYLANTNASVEVEARALQPVLLSSNGQAAVDILNRLQQRLGTLCCLLNEREG